MALSAPVQTAARVLLVGAALACAFGMVGPFPRLEAEFVPWDKAAHFIAFYGLTILLFAAFPARRRIDLALMAILAGAGIELVQQIEGRDAELADIAADAAGALAVLAPLWLEALGRGWRPERRGRRAALLERWIPAKAEPR